MRADKVMMGIWAAFMGVIFSGLVVGAFGMDRGPGPEAAKPALEGAAPTQSGETETKAGARAGHKVVAYYFHGTMRCATCRKIEAYTEEALKTAFPEELKSDQLEWRVINVDEPANEHFVQDYQITTRSVVVADLKDGRQTGWKNLSHIWELIGDKKGFTDYIQGEVRAYLKGSL